MISEKRLSTRTIVDEAIKSAKQARFTWEALLAEMRRHPERDHYSRVVPRKRCDR